MSRSRGVFKSRNTPIITHGKILIDVKETAPIAATLYPLGLRTAPGSPPFCCKLALGNSSWTGKSLSIGSAGRLYGIVAVKIALGSPAADAAAGANLGD